MIVARADASQRTRPALECRTSRAIASPRGRPSLRRRVLSTTVEARHIGGERVEDDHVDRLCRGGRATGVIVSARSSRQRRQLLTHSNRRRHASRNRHAPPD